MNDYIRYLLLSETLKIEDLFADMSTMKQTAFTALAKTALEKALAAKSEKLHLTRKLLNFSLTPEEWDDYKDSRIAMPFFENIRPFEDFYRFAEKRNKALTENLLQALAEKEGKTAVLVSGGFHAPGITRRLRQAGIVTINFVPKISKVDTDKGTQYLSVFTQEQTPLEKLFEGDTLFLAQHPASDGAVHTFVVLSMAKAVQLGDYSLTFLVSWGRQTIHQTLTGYKKLKD